MTDPDRPAKPGEPGPRDRSTMGSAGQFAGLGVQLAMSLALFAFIGVWLDRRLGTSPWLTILLVFVGAGASFYSMYRRVFPASRGKRDGR